VRVLGFIRRFCWRIEIRLRVSGPHRPIVRIGHLRLSDSVEFCGLDRSRSYDVEVGAAWGVTQVVRRVRIPSDGLQVVEIERPPHVTVDGVVRNIDGQRIANVLVSVRSDTGLWRSTTSAGGWFSLGGLSPGPLELEAISPFCERQVETVKLHGVDLRGLGPISLEFGGKGVITGRVTADGRPYADRLPERGPAARAPDARLVVVSQGLPVSRAPWMEVSVDEAGEFVARGLPQSNPVVLCGLLEGYEARRVVARSGDEVEVDLRPVLPVTIQVVDDEGVPRREYITARPSDGAEWLSISGRWLDTGLCRFEGMGEGEWLLDIGWSLHDRDVRRVRVDSEGRVEEPDDVLVVPRRGEISGHAKPPGGGGWEWVEIAIDGRWLGSEATSYGVFLVKKLRPGPHEILIAAPQGLWRRIVEVLPAQRVRPKLELEPQ